MKLMKLSAPLILGVIALAVAIPLVFGAVLPMTPQTIAAGVLTSAIVVTMAALCVEPAASPRRMAHAQYGRAGEDTDIEKEYKQVQADLKQVGDDLRRHAEQAEKDIKVHSQLSQETKASVDKLLVTQGELQARLQAAEQLMVK